MECRVSDDNSVADVESQQSLVCKETDLKYKVDDVPPWYLSLLLGLQQYLTMVGGVVAVPFILAPSLCILENDPARGYLISTIFMVSGLVTFLQSTLGSRLPIVQGSSFAFIVPTLAILHLPQWRCPEKCDLEAMSEDNRTEVWQLRMREVQGAIISASLLQVVIGYFGLVGLILRFITPLTVAPTIALVGLSLVKHGAELAAGNWIISGLTMLLLTVCSQYLRNVNLVVPTYKKLRGFHTVRFNFFQLFPVLITTGIAWGMCVILTTYGVFPENDPARTDTRLSALKEAPWFSFPYPLQWGLPTFSLTSTVGMIAGIVAGITESIGDYYACARMCGAPTPPVHAVNRGIGTEGVGCILSGLWGSGTGVTSYSENIGAIGVTRVGSRRVIQFGSGVMIAVALFGKLGALFPTIPAPVVGGLLCVMFGMVTAVGLSNVQFINMNSSRNLYVLGFSLFMGMVIPEYMATHPDAIRTGVGLLDQMATVLLSTSMFVGGFIGFVLDNTIPGTPEERGLLHWRGMLEATKAKSEDDSKDTYDLPFGMDMIRRHRWCSYIPFLPTFKP